MAKLKYQFTMFSENYKPVACIVEAEGRLGFYGGGKEYQEAIKKICIKRGWTTKDLKKYGYNKFAVMVADKQ